MKYVDIKEDFVDRTLKNLKYFSAISQHEGENNSQFYEVTNLINLCLGLILIPREKRLYLYENFLNVPNDGESWKYGSVIKCVSNKLESRSCAFLRHIRNAIAHGNVKQSDDNNDKIEGLVFKDGSYFETKMTVPQLTAFAEMIANHYLAHFNDPQPIVRKSWCKRTLRKICKKIKKLLRSN